VHTLLTFILEKVPPSQNDLSLPHDELKSLQLNAKYSKIVIYFYLLFKKNFDLNVLLLQVLQQRDLNPFKLQSCEKE